MYIVLFEGLSIYRTGMMFKLLVVLLVSCSAILADITGTNPASGTCLCFTSDSVNVRATACGTVIGSANTGHCFKYKGTKEACTLSGVNYEFFLFDFGGRDGWAAGTYLNTAAASSCATTEGYTCDIAHQGQRVHESGSATPYDCRDSNCGNSCQGGQCVAYVTCSCKRNGQWAPNTGCWRPGTKVALNDGRCNRNIPINTAIATFNSNGNYYAGHAAVFVGCQDDYTIRTYDQWCCRSIGYSTYTSGHSYYNTFAVITNPGICSDRTSWPCRFENAGSTCCPTSVAGCLNNKYWWTPFMDQE